LVNGLGLTGLGGEAGFEQASKLGHRCGDDKIDCGDGEPDFEGHVGVGDGVSAFVGEIEDGDGGDDGGVLDETDGQAGERGKNDADRLRQYDVAGDLPVREAEAEGSFGLAFGDREDAGADDFGGEGAFEEAEGEDARGLTADAEDRGEDEVEQIELDEERCVSDELDIAAGEGFSGDAVRQEQ
jgi:hypothetical protein